jgi:hypothetical protein
MSIEEIKARHERELKMIAELGFTISQKAPAYADRGELLNIVAGLEAQVERLQTALRPFVHDDLCRIFGGNAEGLKSPIFQRNAAVITIGDCIYARDTLMVIEEKVTK